MNIPLMSFGLLFRKAVEIKKFYTHWQKLFVILKFFFKFYQILLAFDIINLNNVYKLNEIQNLRF